MYGNGSVGGVPIFAQFLKSSKKPKYTVKQINQYPTITIAVVIVTTLIYSCKYFSIRLVLSRQISTNTCTKRDFGLDSQGKTLAYYHLCRSKYQILHTKIFSNLANISKGRQHYRRCVSRHLEYFAPLEVGFLHPDWV